MNLLRPTAVATAVVVAMLNDMASFSVEVSAVAFPWIERNYVRFV